MQWTWKLSKHTLSSCRADPGMDPSYHLKIKTNTQSINSSPLKKFVYTCMFFFTMWYCLSNHSNQIKSNQIKSNQIKSNQTKPNRTEPNRIESNRIESNRIESNQIKSNQIKSNQIKSNQSVNIYFHIKIYKQFDFIETETVWRHD